jgi:hypothetical protein
MKRTDLMDVSLEVYKFQLERLRSKTPDERLQLAIERMVLGWEIHRLAVERIEKDSS